MTILTRAAFTKSALALAAGATLAIAAPLAAIAHVSIEPGQAEAGSYALITVKVPNESETEKTNRVELKLPTDTPFTSVRFVPVPGWDAELVRSDLPEPVMVGESEITEAVTSIIWTAQAGSELGDGALLLLPVSLGPIPDVGSVVLTADQTYTDGSVVSWSGTEEGAEKPAPVLYINDEPVGHHDAAATDENTHGDDDSHDDNAASDNAVAANSSDPVARGLGIAGLVAGLAAVVLAFAFRRPSSK
ncbi:YcnI family protein [Salinibacterium sp. M195]|uniref:YcnI family copper-binding membrane protein n=1 Tax=Salinibacterium sp. M195 TaxID=2583374 RepID=UPI001C635005|nr:YcnI family protein [Salinibacterium sp. M195]QYH35864.1 YcnI family protein [Salinibacterium sp. M195]